ncbi:MAG: glycosyltransferase [Candidatus Eisenbacteria bacterium]
MRNDPHISLVVPARNEGEHLKRLLDTVDDARARYRGGAHAIEVIVADNGSTDSTPEIAMARGCSVVNVSTRCIAAVRNGGAAVACGRLLAFADADFGIHPETFNYIDTVMRNPAFIGGGTGLVMERRSLGIAVTLLIIMPPFWLIGIDGGVLFCRRSDFLLVGGFDESFRASEDVRLLRALRYLGRSRRPREVLATRHAARRLRVPQALAVVSCRKFDKHGDWHMLAGLFRWVFWLLFSRKKMDDFIQRYWYENDDHS